MDGKDMKSSFKRVCQFTALKIIALRYLKRVCMRMEGGKMRILCEFTFRVFYQRNCCWQRR